MCTAIMLAIVQCSASMRLQALAYIHFTGQALQKHLAVQTTRQGVLWKARAMTTVSASLTVQRDVMMGAYQSSWYMSFPSLAASNSCLHNTCCLSCGLQKLQNLYFATSHCGNSLVASA